MQTFLLLLGVLQNRSLEDSLRETEGRYAHEVNGLNSGIQQLEGELGQVRAQLERQAAEYENLLSLKTKLEAEIATYHRLLEGVVDDDKGDTNRWERMSLGTVIKQWMGKQYSWHLIAPSP